MEDAHIAITDVNGDMVSFFGVFDGHGGAEVARFCQKYLTPEVMKLKEFEEGAMEECLIKGFHKIDEMLRDPKHYQEIEQFKTREGGEKDGDDNEGINGMDAFDVLKRVFQLKRFSMPENNNGPSERTPPPRLESQPEESQVQAGCTAVVAVKKGNELYVANAGDSRGVLSRAGQAVALSEDHKPAQETERMRIIAAGGYLTDVGGVWRVNGNLNLSRAIGDLKYKNNTELAAKDQIITAQPDVRKVILTPEDRFFVLACDGVWDVMTNQEVVDFVEARLEQDLAPTTIACQLLDHCLASDPREARGIGCDNMTALVVLLVKPSS